MDSQDILRLYASRSILFPDDQGVEQPVLGALVEELGAGMGTDKVELEFSDLGNTLGYQLSGGCKEGQLVYKNREWTALGPRRIVGGEEELGEPEVGQNFAVFIAEHTSGFKIDEHDGSLLNELLGGEHRVEFAEREFDDRVFQEAEKTVLR